MNSFKINLFNKEIINKFAEDVPNIYMKYYENIRNALELIQNYDYLNSFFEKKDKKIYKNNEFLKCLDEIKKDNLLVYFYKKDCNACSLLKKDLNNIIKKDKLTVYAVDIMKNDNDEILYNYVDIKYTPTIIRFQKSKEVKRIEGNNGYKKIK